MDFTYIIPTYNQIELVETCIKSLLKFVPEAKIIICDDASKSEVVMGLQEITKKYNAKLITNFWNAGFGYNCNRGIFAADTSHVVLVNNDIEFTENIEPELIKILEKDPKIGVVGNLLFYPDGRVQHGGHLFVGPKSDMGHYDYRLPLSMANMSLKDRYNISVTGALMVLSKEMIKQIGGFKKEYYLAYEDGELCFRAWHTGWRVYYTAKYAAIHHEGVTRGVTPEQKQRTNTLRKEQISRDSYFRDIVIYDFEDIKRRIDSANGKSTKKRPHRIGVVRGGALGDCVLTTGVIKELKIRNPESEIYISTACPYPYTHDTNVKKIFNNSQQMLEQVDTVYDLDLAYEKEPKKKVWEAYADGCFGEDGYVKESVLPVLSASIDARRSVQQNALRTLRFMDKLCVIHAARGCWKMKRWSDEKWDAVVAHLKEIGYATVCIGAGNDYIPKHINLNLHSKLQLPEVLELIRMSDLFMGIDGGLMHIALSTETPVVALFSVADPECFVYRWNKTVVVGPNSECKYCRNKVKPPVTGVQCVQGDNQCINSIMASDVINAIEIIKGEK